MSFKRLLYDVETNGLLPEHVDPPFCMDRLSWATPTLNLSV